MAEKTKKGASVLPEVHFEDFEMPDLEFGDVGLEGLQDLNLNLFDVGGKKYYSEETRYMKAKIYPKQKGGAMSKSVGNEHTGGGGGKKTNASSRGKKMPKASKKKSGNY